MVAVHRAPKNVEFALKQNSGRQRSEKPVFAPQPVEWVMLPQERALKRVRFAENQDDNNAEVPEPTTETAPPNLPAEAASSSSAPTPSVDPALPASATEVPDQVMSEGASSSSDAAVRLSMKRSSDSSNSESETKEASH